MQGLYTIIYESFVFIFTSYSQYTQSVRQKNIRVHFYYDFRIEKEKKNFYTHCQWFPLILLFHIDSMSPFKLERTWALWCMHATCSLKIPICYQTLGELKNKKLYAPHFTFLSVLFIIIIPSDESTLLSRNEIMLHLTSALIN